MGISCYLSGNNATIRSAHKVWLSKSYWRQANSVVTVSSTDNLLFLLRNQYLATQKNRFVTQWYSPL